MNSGALSLSGIRLQRVELQQAIHWPWSLRCERSAYFIVARGTPLQFDRAGQRLTIPIGAMLVAVGGADVSIEPMPTPPAEQASSVECLVLRVDLCEPLRFGLKGTLPTELLLGDTCRAQRERIAQIATMIGIAGKTEGFTTSTRIDRLAELLFLEVVEHYLCSAQFDTGLASALTDRRLGPALHAIHDNPDRGWTVGKLAQLASMSRSLFAARFKTALNETPVNYVRLCRMYKARQMLESSSASVDQVARESGYASLSSFVKAFAQVNGETPGRWRERRRVSESQEIAR
jgi:AraC-like DNA-binding protein